MAKKSTTYSTLWVVDLNMDKLEEEFPALFFFQEDLFKSLKNKNRQHFTTMYRTVHDIQKVYIEHDEKGQPLRAKKVKGRDGEWQYKESCIGMNGQLLTGAAVEEEYKHRINAFLNTTITVIL